MAGDSPRQLVNIVLMIRTTGVITFLANVRVLQVIVASAAPVYSLDLDSLHRCYPLIFSSLDFLLREGAIVPIVIRLKKGSCFFFIR